MRHALLVVKEEDGMIARGDIPNLEVGRIIHYGVNRSESSQYLRNRSSPRAVKGISVGETAACQSFLYVLRHHEQVGSVDGMLRVEVELAKKGRAVGLTVEKWRGRWWMIGLGTG